MMYLSKWISATLAIVLLAGSAAAADTVSGGKVVEINSIVDPDRIRRLDLSVLGD